MRKPRDHAKEYQRRLQRAAARGLSKSQARGHARPGEKTVSAKLRPKLPDNRLQISLKSLKSGTSLSKAAHEGGISAERLRLYVADHKLATKRGRRWIFRKRGVRWQAITYTDGRVMIVQVASAKQISRIAKYHNAVKRFLRTKIISSLNPFVGIEVIDATGHHYLLETNPNAILRITSSGEPTFEQFYKFIP
jgi:hypothetical protein